ncbi:hypothetical protein B0H10DRAFT_2031054 [Mycena sp. CBHHK59/15]|nr:hypothetical protein B0H10DRAFT_2031054 [Mycena sp. CBHHK59/15]
MVVCIHPFIHPFANMRLGPGHRAERRTAFLGRMVAVMIVSIVKSLTRLCEEEGIKLSSTALKYLRNRYVAPHVDFSRLAFKPLPSENAQNTDEELEVNGSLLNDSYPADATCTNSTPAPLRANAAGAEGETQPRRRVRDKKTPTRNAATIRSRDVEAGEPVRPKKRARIEDIPAPRSSRSTRSKKGIRYARFPGFNDRHIPSRRTREKPRTGYAARSDRPRLPPTPDSESRCFRNRA